MTEVSPSISPAPRPVDGGASAAARVLGDVLLDDVDALADRLLRVVIRREPSYAELSRTGGDELRRAVRENIELCIRSLAGDIPDSVDPRERCRLTGRLRALQGVPLEAVLRAYRVGGRIIWDELLAASRRHFAGEYDHALLGLGSEIWRLIDASSTVLAEAYQEEARRCGRASGHGQAFLNAILENGGDDPALLGQAAAALGVPLRGALLCVVGLIDSARDEPLRAPQDVLAAHGIVSSWHPRSADVVGLVVLGTRRPRTVLDTLGPAVAGPVGASPVIHELGQLRRAYEMAHTAACTLSEPGLATVDDRLPEALLVNSPQLLDRLLSVAFGDLLAVPQPHRKTLIRTLRALLGCNGSATQAARILHCHRNTVLYRLQRIEELTCRRLGEPRDRLLLTLGLMALRPGRTRRGTTDA
ncbi:PucR family transcriptional regulator [Gandjariella thermophila]|uniref:PucR family transcriptional regulator n=1 Tax=Gandjariella thermophila TaxID=1931992 RepID=A0A4D4JCZ5_9PSEU|nr:helix-turn-helix domain-containing protein [Gandjariella thermophila]GDY31767.1 hypothetical protein GTS_34000 [Gandjariella thermophila]